MKRLLAGLVLGLLVSQPVTAQVLGTGVLPVTEVGTQLFQSIVTAAQSTISAIEDVAQTAMAVENLLPLEAIETAQGIQEDLEALSLIMQQAEVVYYDLQSLQAQVTRLFQLDTVPIGTSELQLRLAEIRRMRYGLWSYVTQLQTLGRTAQRTIQHLHGLLGTIGAVLGNKQGQQTVAQVNATISKTLTIQAAQIASYQQAGAVDKLEELMILEALGRIHLEVMADWPVR